MPYNLLTLFTQRNFVADFLQVKCHFDGKRPFCVFEPPLGGLRATYDVHLRYKGSSSPTILCVGKLG